MEPLIAFTWLAFAIFIFLGLMVAAYVAFVRGANLMLVVPKYLASLVLYGACTYLTMWPMFVMIYAGAHTKPVGNVFSLQGRLIMTDVLLLYAASGWLLCSLVYGRLIGRRGLDIK